MASQGAGGYAYPEFLADTEWLMEHLHDDSIAIVDTDVAAAYHRGHIPGAVLVPDNYEKDPASGRTHILPAESFAQMMESLGIGDDTTVVVYDNSRSLYAGRLWWALRYYGHVDVQVLDGGWREWVSKGMPTSIKPRQTRDGARFTSKPDASLIATTDELKSIHDKPGTVVWDVRTREEYTGENPRHNRRPGHIPGATLLEWLEMMDERTHTFRPAEEMRRILDSKGITPAKEVVVH